ncbi:MAG: hypothetical protein K2X38_09580 [Gemmataceae bacterium]|nr:hypothetical protein [Gemmataceae bacterium]
MADRLEELRGVSEIDDNDARLMGRTWPRDLLQWAVARIEALEGIVNAVMAEGLQSDLIQAVSCAECGERMTFDAEHKEWLCPLFHQAEPEEEVHLEVVTAIKAGECERQLYGLRPLSASGIVAALAKGDDLTLGDVPLFRRAVQVDALRGGLEAAEEAFRLYSRTKSVEEFKRDYDAFLADVLRSPAAGWWPWKALARAAELGVQLRATLDITEIWDRRQGRE